MRVLSTLILSLALGFSAIADCASRGVWALPAFGKIAPEGLIVLETYARSQRIIDSINSSYMVYLELNDTLVELEVLEICHGMFEVSQAILRPKTKLKPGEEYLLQIRHRQTSRDLNPERYNQKTENYERIKWVVDESVSSTSSSWAKGPTVQDYSLFWFGCGPACHVNFEYQIDIPDSSFLLMRVELMEVGSEITWQYHLPIANNGEFSIGHGMCSGPFYFQTKAKYLVRFALLDPNGDLRDSYTEWIPFDSPYSKTGDMD